MEKIKALREWLLVPAGLLFVLGVAAACLGVTVNAPFVGLVGGVTLAIFALGLGWGAVLGAATKGWLGAGVLLVVGMGLNTIVAGGWAIPVVGGVGAALMALAWGGLAAQLLALVRVDANTRV